VGLGSLIDWPIINVVRAWYEEGCCLTAKKLETPANPVAKTMSHHHLSNGLM
jgi:hypothetical protein